MGNLDLCTDTNGECLLRTDEVGSEFVAKLLVRLMAGEDLSDVMHGRPHLTPRSRCVNCALRVMRDLAPLLTVEQWGEQVEGGRRTYRRQRRHYEARAQRGPPFKLF